MADPEKESYKYRPIKHIHIILDRQFRQVVLFI